MTTSEKLNSLTDRAIFEAIANAYLRQRFPAMANLIAGGINVKGETIKGKLDSFVKSGNNHFSLVEHTTNDSNLEVKWLYDKKNYTGKKKVATVNDGDLVKAIKEADSIRADLPEATFTIYLTTNKVVKNDLWLKVIKKANSANVEVEILDVSAIAHFLDNDPSGQYLRKSFLQIEQELLSEGLFREIQQRNLDQYSKESFIKPDIIIEHWQQGDVENKMGSSSRLLTLLVAESGMGKTTLAFSMLKNQVNMGGRILWVTPEAVRDASDPVHLIEQTIRYYNNAIYFNDDTRKLLTQKKTLIVVDDVNKSDNPSTILNKLIAWGMDTDNEATQLFSILCPVWPKFLYEIAQLEKKDDGFNCLVLDRPSARAAEDLAIKNLAAAGIALTGTEIKELTEMNGYDPLLMGLNLISIKKRGQYIPNQAKTVIADFVSDKLTEVSANTGFPDFKQKLLLKKVGMAMITHNKVHPNYNDFLTWFDQTPEVILLIDALGSSQELFLVKDDGKIQFRHDRIRDHIIAEGFKILLEKVKENIITLAEPYFADTLALALVEYQVNEEELYQIISVNPESIFNTLKYLQGPEDQAYFDKIVGVIEQWKNSPEFPSFNIPMMEGINWSLLYTETKEIRKITNKLPNDRILHLALFRNGNAVGGINFFLSFPDFEPWGGNSLRDVMVSHAKIKHQPQLKSQLLWVIENHKGLNPSAKAGIYLLAGYLKLEGIAIKLQELWEEDKHPEVYIYYLWATINCANKKEADYLEGCLNEFESLIDNEQEGHRFSKSTKKGIIYWYSKCRWSLTVEQILLFNQLFDRYPRLISTFFSTIDHPLAMERTIVTVGSKLGVASEGTNNYYLLSNDRWDYKKNKYRLTKASLAYLCTAWQNPVNPDGIRKIAFRIWSGNEVPDKVIALCKPIKPDDKILYERAIIERVELGDKTAANEFFPMIRKRRHLMEKLKNIWDEDCKSFYNAFVLEKAERFNNEEFSYDYVNFLTDLPVQEAEDVLKKNWEILKKDPFAIQSAVYLATPDMLQLVKDSVANLPDPATAFKYIDFLYHFIDANNFKISFHQLVVLEPYLQFLDKNSLRWITEYCFKAGFRDWAIAHIYPYLNTEDQVYFKPETNDIVQEIYKFLQGDSRFMAGNLVEHLKRRGINKITALTAMKQFSLTDHSPKGFEFVANFLMITGNRADLKLLDNYKDFDFPEINKEHLYKFVSYAIRKRTPF